MRTFDYWLFIQCQLDQVIYELMRITADGSQRFWYEGFFRQSRKSVYFERIYAAARVDDEVRTGVVAQAEGSMYLG